jgi:hypothetical protein
VICKLVLAATVYHIWRERNNRFHNSQARPPDVLVSAIVEDVRFRLMGLKYKNWNRVATVLKVWGIHAPNVYDDGG